jgi:hypothetical protein
MQNLKVGQAVRLSIGTKSGDNRRGCGVQISRLGPVAAPARLLAALRFAGAFRAGGTACPTSAYRN